jgi:predicted O-methyltransferase YrrM
MATVRPVPVPTWIEQLYLRLPMGARRAGYLARTRPGHFYSPYPDLAEIRERAGEIWKPLDSAPGIDLRETQQWALLDDLAGLAPDLPFADSESSIATGRYRPDNRPYVLGDAVVLAAMLRHLGPRRYVEVGSGWSTAVALDVRDHYLDDTEIICIDPYPTRLLDVLAGENPAQFSLRRESVQDTNADVFDQLEAGDVLFIDSTHVVRAGSDVNHLVFEILPRLAPGVAVHVHDVFDGFEYPRRWVEERRAWSEAYLVRAFLQFNDAFAVTLFTSWLHARDPARYLSALPQARQNPGAQLWLTRR